jgi:hypothetical protein
MVSMVLSNFLEDVLQGELVPAQIPQSRAVGMRAIERTVECGGRVPGGITATQLRCDSAWVVKLTERVGQAEVGSAPFEVSRLCRLPRAR